jgi:hypothetical protein
MARAERRSHRCDGAENIATASLAGKRNRFGESFIQHVERVAVGILHA